MNQLVLLLVGALLLVATSFRSAVAQQKDPTCIPGTSAAIKADLMRILVICYVYGCPDSLTRKIAKTFNQFQYNDMNRSDGMADDGGDTEEVNIKVLSKLAKLTSALEKDRSAALSTCKDFLSLLNRLTMDLLQIDNKKCFMEPQAKYPTEDLMGDDDDQPIDCDEMTVYLKELKRYYTNQCKNKGKECPEQLQKAVSWFNRAYKQTGKNCYYDAYDYLDH